MDKQSEFENIFSFDVEEWFHIRRNEDHLPQDTWQGMPARLPDALGRTLELLEETGNRATFFWLGWCAERYPEWVRRVAGTGHEIACHGWGHTALDRFSPETFREELRRSRGRLEDLSGGPVKGFRAPSLSLGPETAWMMEVLAEEGFTYDSSLLVTPIRVNRPQKPAAGSPAMEGLVPKLNDPHPWRWTMKAGSIVELPISVRRVAGVNLPFGGGFFFRCAPYRAVAATVRRMNDRTEPAVFYAHPWELDEASPAPRRPRLEHFSHRFLLAAGRRKYIRLLNEFRFAPAREVIERMPVLLT